MSDLETTLEKAIERIRVAHNEVESSYKHFADLWNAYNEGRESAVQEKDGQP